jgi:hypothetical protein
MGKRLWSVFTDDMNHCIFTGSDRVERHHIFGGANRKKSEKYGFVIPLRPDLHPNGVHYNPSNLLGITDIELKMMAQDYFEKHIGNRSLFREEFGKSWL